MRYFLLFLLLWTTSVFALQSPVPSPAAQTEQAPKEMPRVIMARVGTREITVEEFMGFLAKNPTRVKEATTDEGKAGLLREAIGNELLMLAMREEGLLPENPTEADQKKAFVQLINKHFPPPPTPDDATLRDYYQKHTSDFGIPASVRLSQIQIRVKESPSEEDKANARQRAEAALARIEAGESFAAIAAELSENPRAKANQGDVGFVWRDGNAWLTQSLKGLKKGEHTGVLESPVGYDILMLTDEREAIITPFEEARDSVAKKLQVKQQAQARNAYVKQLADRVGVEIVLDEMKGSFPNGVFP
ncbi:peptidyl-prolyl cis-trans isomerase [uncultured Thiocystis sp.]|jgi:hypothetical protein|uniref:peptidylprolyl isomerase n=1 Tax=uncultured Thiocystis sp. TaxID=1202134 RepID=UPI0025F1C8F6|nr:peptidyl-prolyl cis-trans isomerase [uncultured Thiocystis sp.]